MVLLTGCSFVHGASDTSSSSPDGNTATGPDARRPDAPKPIDAKPDAPRGSLMVSVVKESATDINLTTEGTTDWAHWGMGGTTAYDHRNGVTAISNLAASPATGITGAPLTASWSNGTPNGSASQTNTGVAVHQGSTMTFTVPAGIAPQTLRVYAGVQESSARLDLTLSDSSATAPAQTESSSNATTNVQYTIVYNAASDGQTLTISWTDTQDFGNITQSFTVLLSATLY